PLTRGCVRPSIRGAALTPLLPRRSIAAGRAPWTSGSSITSTTAMCRSPSSTRAGCVSSSATTRRGSIRVTRPNNPRPPAARVGARGRGPMRGIFRAAVTQGTRRIRLGPCVYCLPLYHPLRLIEEVCMLDHLSRGRFEFGVGRGIVPYEMAYFNLHHLETEEIYREALEVILQGLTSDVLDHRGPRYTYRKVPMLLRPFHQPHPPLWYGMGHAAGAEWAATNKVHVISNHPAEMARPLFERYRDVWHRKHGAEPIPKLGMSRHIVVAPTEGEAVALGRPS